MLDMEHIVLGLGMQFKTRGLTLATAESCTGGLVAGTLTAVSGSSEWFRGGIVAYANEVKVRLLGVDFAAITRHGAVSEAVALAMAKGALTALDAQVAVAVTGIAGPTGGTPDKPVGLVWIAWAWPGPLGPARPVGSVGPVGPVGPVDLGGPMVEAERHLFPGDRAQVRRAATEQAIKGLAQRVGRATALA